MEQKVFLLLFFYFLKEAALLWINQEHTTSLCARQVFFLLFFLIQNKIAQDLNCVITTSLNIWPDDIMIWLIALLSARPLAVKMKLPLEMMRGETYHKSTCPH